jgi:hypothetical protein
MAVTIINPLPGVNGIPDVLVKIANFVRNLAIVIAPMMFIYAGIRFIFAGGREQEIRTARAIILWTFVGLIVVLSADVLIGFISYIVNGS